MAAVTIFWNPPLPHLMPLSSEAKPAKPPRMRQCSYYSSVFENGQVGEGEGCPNPFFRESRECFMKHTESSQGPSASRRSHVVKMSPLMDVPACARP